MSKSIRSKLKINMLVIALCLAAFTTTPVFAEDEEPFNPPTPENNAGCSIEEETDGDCGVPTKSPKPKVHAKRLTTYSGRGSPSL